MPARFSDEQVATTVSVVIPCKDDALLLARCLQALGAQTRPAEEIVVVDNNSSDDSAATELAAGATVVACAQPGIPAASAHGYDAARGELLLRLDADCLPPCTWIADAIASFERHPEAGAVTGAARFYNDPRLLRRPLAAAYLAAYVLCAVPALGHRPLFGTNFAMRRSAWQELSAEVVRDDPERHDDLDLSFQIGARYPILRLRGAAMGMSIRPFRDSRSFRRRGRRGLHTVTSHWPEDFPPYRWRRIRHRERHRLPESRGD